MYRRPRFLAQLHAIQEEMARECDYDVDLFAEMIRQGTPPLHGPSRIIRGQRVTTPGRNANNFNSNNTSTNNKPPKIDQK